MENTRRSRHCHSPLVFQSTFLIILSLCLANANGLTNQAESLRRFYREKLIDRLIVDTGTIFDLKDSIFGQELRKDARESNIHNIIYPQTGLKEKDKIEKLPGQPAVDFDQYGGYVTVDIAKGRAFYYYFAEAPKSNESLPLLLWLNGGPGCSSLAYGAMQELGPFRVMSDGKTLFRNRFSWNNVANVLFLESPAGVGFSYSNTTSDSKTNGDRTTAADNYWFLRNWLRRFPEYKNRDLYISGESYAGHYVPQLAHFIRTMNKRVNKNNIINLKGIIIGNAVLHDETDYHGMYDYLWTHALISDQLRNDIFKYCDFSPTATNQTDQCTTAAKEADQLSYYILDLYNIYAPLCHTSGVTVTPTRVSVLNFDPCNDQYIHAYLNTPQVQEALHANVTKLNYDWEACSNIKWTNSPPSILPLLHEFISDGLQVWIFSGDTDGVVPVTSTRYSINKMNLTTTTAWHPWFVDQEVGGYTEVYKGAGEITFATVRGAGHEVPTYQPKRALTLITHFLAGSPLPKSSAPESNR